MTPTDERRARALFNETVDQKLCEWDELGISQRPFLAAARAIRASYERQFTKAGAMSLSPEERARTMVVAWRDQGYMRVGTPQVVINDIAAVIRDAYERAAQIAKEEGEAYCKARGQDCTPFRERGRLCPECPIDYFDTAEDRILNLAKGEEK